MHFVQRLLTKFIPIAVAILVATNPPATFAADLNWTGNGGVFFNDAGNWDPGQPPTAGDNLTFDGSASSFNLIIAGTQFGNDLSFLGGDYSIEGGSGSLLTSLNTSIDGGTLEVGGPNTDWNNTNDIFVGDVANGTLNISFSANVEHSGLVIGRSALGNGVVNLTGGAALGSSNILSTGRIGLNGIGELNLSGGARSDMSSALMGTEVGSTGTLNVTGAGTRFFTHGFDMRAGDEGTGVINVSSGGLIRSIGNGNMTAGHEVGGVGTIAVNGGTATSDNFTIIGRSGTGTFTATNGSDVTSELQFILGQNEGASGTATFDNSTLDITNSNHDLFVGVDGLGQMTVRNNSTINVADQVRIGVNAASTGDNRLTITGGSTVTSGHDVFVGLGGNGTLLLDGGSTLTARAVDTGHLSGATGTTIIDGPGTTANLQFLWNNSGAANVTVSDGAQVNVNTPSSSTVSVTMGDDTTADGTLTITGVSGGTPSRVTANKGMEVGGSSNESGGRGTVNIEAGGQLVTAGGSIGVNAASGSGGTGTVNINGNGSMWQSSAGITVGQIGDGQLNVTGGGQVDAGANLIVGDTNNANAGAASVTVSGSAGGTPSTVNVQSILSVGNDRAATMTVSNGAVLNTGIDGSNAAIGDSTLSTGAVMNVDDATWNHQGGRIQVGRNGGSASAPSTLNVTNGGTVTTPLILVSDQNPTSHGLVRINGTGSSITATSWAIVGDEGPGTMIVGDSGLFNVAEFLHVGGISTGDGNLIIEDGGNVVIAGDTAIGRDGGSSGTLTVRSGGTLTTNGLQVARDSGSTGTIRANGGGVINLTPGSTLSVGGTATTDGGVGNLVLAGSTINADSVVVRSGSTINITAGTLRLGTFSRMPGSNFSLGVNGKLAFTGNTVLDADLIADIFNDDPALNSHAIGSPGGATLEVEGVASLDAPLRLNGGFFTVGSISDLSNLDWDSGTLSLTAMNVNIESGGLFGDQLLLQPGQNLSITQTTTNNGLINATASSLSFLGGLTNNADLVLVNTSIQGPVTSPAGSTVTVVGQANFNGLVSGAGNFYGPGSANFNGGFAPGDSPSIVAFEGDMVSTQSLFIEIGGNDNSGPAEFDQLVIDGSASIGGLLDVSLIDLGSGTYVPQLGDSFEIISAADGLTGDFSQFNLPALAGGLDWSHSANGNAYVLSVVVGNGVNGDFDNDGDWDGADIDALVASIAGGSTDTGFDLDGDGMIDEDDLDEWLIVAGAENLASGNAYLYGDANLDGVVDTSDFNLWNSNKFTALAAWTAGDFTADGSVDTSDFNRWNSNKFQSSDSAIAVPESATGIAAFLFAAVVLMPIFRRSRNGRVS